MSEIFKVRSSSFGSFFDCPLRWAEVNLYGNSLPSTAPACIGSAVHESTAVYDQHEADGDPISVLDSAEVAVNYIRNPQEEVIWGDVRQDKAVERAVGVHLRYCNEIAPKMTYEVIERTLEPLQVEVNDDVTIELTGTLDRVYTKMVPVLEPLANAHSIPVKRYGVSDVKTGMRAMSMNSGKHKAQVGIYSMLAENTLGLPMTLPETLIALQTSTNYEAGLLVVDNARDALLGTDDSIGLLQCMGTMLKEGLFYGNPQSWLCSEKFCPKFNNCNFK